MSKAKTDGIKLIANNKKARHDYFVEDSFEAGIVLHGTEVKSLRQGHCSIKESFVDIDNGEVFIHQMHISPYEKGNIFNKDPLRTRKLLLHKSEISKMIGQINQKGYTLIPLKVYFSGSLVKVQIGLCKGKKLYDKRQDISKRDQLREAQRVHEGIISGVTNWGIYVELPNTIEGMVHVSILPGDYYYYDEKTYSMVGERTGRTFKLGEKAKIRVKDVDMMLKNIDFELVEDDDYEQSEDGWN